MNVQLTLEESNEPIGIKSIFRNERKAFSVRGRGQKQLRKSTKIVYRVKSFRLPFYNIHSLA
jgi:hypothetical protein